MRRRRRNGRRKVAGIITGMIGQGGRVVKPGEWAFLGEGVVKVYRVYVLYIPARAEVPPSPGPAAVQSPSIR